ncbi:MAG: ABC transporter permease [Bradymonadaceae bacterium]
MDTMVRGATAIETGQVQIQSASYAEESKIWKTFPAGDQLYEQLERLDPVEAVQARVEYYGLVGTEERSQVARLVGLDAGRAPQSSPLRDAVVEGRWFGPPTDGGERPREALVGADLARQIGVGVGDELVVFAEAADGSLGNDLVQIVGLVRAGNNRIDRQTVYLRLANAQFIAAMEGEIHELSIWTHELRSSEQTLDRIEEVAKAWETEHLSGSTTFAAGEERPTELVVRPWKELVPQLSQIVEMSRSSSWIFYLIVYFIAALGILNTQRMSALERHREFGVMQAIGMTPSRLFGTVLVETTLLTLFGALLGAAVGTGLNLYFAEYGFDMGMFADGDSFSYMGIAFSERVYFSVTLEGVLTPVAALLPVALVCGLWPAIASARLNPAIALSGRD